MSVSAADRKIWARIASKPKTLCISVSEEVNFSAIDSERRNVNYGSVRSRSMLISNILRSFGSYCDCISMWSSVTDRNVQSATPRCSITAAVFGGACNLLCLILENYQFYYLARIPAIWNFSFIFLEVIAMTPLLALFVLRNFALVVFIYAFTLFLILSWRISHLVQYYFLGGPALFYKIDMPGLLLVFLGFISTAVVLTRVSFHFLIFIRHALKCVRPAS